MDDKKRKGSELDDDYDLSALYSSDLEDEDDERDSGKARVKTRMLAKGQNRAGRPARSEPVVKEPPARAGAGTDPYSSITQPPLTSVNDRRGFGREIEEGDDADDDSQAHVVHEGADTTTRYVEEGRRVPLWAWVSGVGGAALLLVLLARLLWPGDATYAVRVHNAPPGSTLYIDNVYSGVPDANGTITATGLQRGNSHYSLRVTNPDYQEVLIPDIHSEDGADQRVDLPPPIPIKSQPVPQPSTAKPPARETPQSEVEYNGPMVEVAAGEFTLGDDTHLADERPAHRVNVAAFYIDKYEVTNEQYRKFCDATQRPFPLSPSWNPKYVASNPHGPVTGVSWEDAAAYAAWAGKRLPTEAEWEKAASWDPATGQKRLWPWGNSDGPGRANIMRRSPSLAAAGQYDRGASAYGALDMAGNVAEWVDAYYEPYEGNTARNAAFGEKYRVVRGGSCISTLDDARTTRRFYYSAQERNKRDLLVGFRCAVSADDPGLRKRLQERTN